MMNIGWIFKTFLRRPFAQNGGEYFHLGGECAIIFEHKSSQGFGSSTGISSGMDTTIIEVFDSWERNYQQSVPEAHSFVTALPRFLSRSLVINQVMSYIVVVIDVHCSASTFHVSTVNWINAIVNDSLTHWYVKLLVSTFKRSQSQSQSLQVPRASGPTKLL